MCRSYNKCTSGETMGHYECKDMDTIIILKIASATEKNASTSNQAETVENQKQGTTHMNSIRTQKPAEFRLGMSNAAFFRTVSSLQSGIICISDSIGKLSGRTVVFMTR